MGKLSKEFKELNVQLSKVPKPHAQSSKLEQEKSIEFLSKQYDDLISANKEVKKVLKRLTNRLDEIAVKSERMGKALDDIEAYSYQYNVKVLGVPEINRNESSLDTTNLCLKLFIAYQYEIQVRVNPKPIVCKFTRRLSKESLMQVRKEVENVKPSQLGFSNELDTASDMIKVLDHLTPKAQFLRYEAKKFKSMNNYAYCWAKNNSVFLREQDNTRKIKISELEDLQKLAASANGDPDK